MSVVLVREYWAYHHWANRKLFEVTAALGEEAAGRPVGRQSSDPTLRAMLVHIYGAERFWLETWRGRPPTVVRGDPTYGLVIRALGELRRRWDELEAEQRRFLDDLVETDLARPVDGTTPEGRTYSRPMGMFRRAGARGRSRRSEEHTSELQSQSNIVCRLLLEKKKKTTRRAYKTTKATFTPACGAATCANSDGIKMMPRLMRICRPHALGTKAIPLFTSTGRRT